MQRDTDEQVVKARWPDAESWGPIEYCYRCRQNICPSGSPHPDEFEIVSEKGKTILGIGITESDAWNDAAERIRKEGRSE